MFGCFFFFCFFSFFLRRGLPLACSKVCLDASVDNVQSRAHELYGIIWLCSWSTFLFCRICLGRRCLHNLVGFYFHCFFQLSGQFNHPWPNSRHWQNGKQRKGREEKAITLRKWANRGWHLLTCVPSILPGGSDQDKPELRVIGDMVPVISCPLYVSPLLFRLRECMELSFLNLFLLRSGQLQVFIWHLGIYNLKSGL